MSTRIPRLGSALAALLILASAAPGASAQGSAAAGRTAVVQADRENFRAAPSGSILAEVVAGAALVPGRSSDQWREATLEGWVWARSLGAEQGGEHDLVVSASGGENLRAEPNGDVVARLRQGMRLDRIEERGGWIRVRRTGWIWEPSLAIRDAPGAAPRGAAAEARARRASAEAAAAAGGDGDTPSSQQREFTAAGRSGLVVMDRAAGDTLARVSPGSSIEVVARDGDWTRVRIEGWVVTASLGPADTTELIVLRDVDTEFIQQQPELFRGRLVDWEAQFIGLQQAERFRSEFLEGERYILARGPGEEAGFVYIAVPAELLEAVRALTPLQRIRVVGRIRSARSALTGAPVIDLLELRPQER